MISIFFKKLLLVLCLFCIYPNFAFCLTYLDGSAIACSDGNATYSPTTRTCGLGSDRVYLSIGLFSSNIVASQINYMRAGTYLRNSGSSAYGALLITTGGASDAARTIVKAYPGEERQVIIGTATRGATYNSNPNDATGVGSWMYYPNPAVSVYGVGNVTIDGIKTYGSVYLVGNVANITVQNCDIGGGGDGAGDSQGNTLRINGGTAPPGISNILISNCMIHDNCRRYEDATGSLLIAYSWSGTIEKCTFYNGYGNDLENKDGRFQSGKNTYIRNNFFKHSAVNSIDTGLRGYNQYPETAYVYIYNNIFLRKTLGYIVLGSPATAEIVYNNTFVDCAQDIESSAVSGGPYPISNYNNIFYHSVTGKVALEIVSISYLTASDYNIYNGSMKWQSPVDTTAANNFSSWKTWSGKDVNSITSSPAFINSVGTAAADYKRSSYAENFVGSSYGIHAGAYEIGSEIIGADFSAPAASYGVKVYVSGSFQIAPLKFYNGTSWVRPPVKAYIGGVWQTLQTP